MQCNREDCNCYSDVDVYYKDGSSEALCSNHAWEADNVEQGIPQHGSDVVNVPIPAEGDGND